MPAFAAHGDPEHPAVVRGLVDHIWIRERMGRLVEHDLDVPSVQELGRRLDEHVRHEERVLFPLIEQSLPDDALAKLGERIAAAERA